MKKLHLPRFAGFIALTLAALGTISAAYGTQTAIGVLLCSSIFASSFLQSNVLGVSPRSDRLTGHNMGNVDLWYGLPYVTVDIPTVTLATATSPVDLATIDLPPGLGRFVVLGYTLEAITAAGTLAAATIAVRTAAAGAGTVVVTATALTGVTAIDLAVTTNMGLTGAIVNAATVTQLFVRQTVDSANAGTVAGRILLQAVR